MFLNSIDSIKRFMTASVSSKTTYSSSTVEPIASRPRNYMFKLISKNFSGLLFRMYDDSPSSSSCLSVSLTKTRDCISSATHQFFQTADFHSDLNAFCAFLDDKVIGNVELNKRYSNFYKLSGLDENSGLMENAPLYVQQMPYNFIMTAMFPDQAKHAYELTINMPVKQQIQAISELFCSLNIVQMEGLKFFDSLLNKEALSFLTKRLQK